MPEAPAQPATPPADPATPPATPAQEPPAEPTDWKAEARKWETRAKENKSKLDEAAPRLAEYDRLVAASKTDLERATEEATRWQTEAETWRKSAVGSKVAEFASASFADPSDAVGALAEKNYLDAGGQINEGAIKADLEEVLARKPHWRRQEGTPAPRVPAPNPAQGSGVDGNPAANPASQFAAILQGQINGRG